MISVVVPVYKSEKTLEKCVNSLLKQTETDMEILLIVDGPPDNSGVLCDELAKKDARIRVINQVNQGVSKARNRGISEAKGEYIRFVDSDDFVDEDSNELLLNALQSHDADMVIAGYHHLYFGRDILRVPASGSFDLKKLSKEDESAFLELYRAGFLNMPWNKLYKKELLQNGFPTDLNLGEDLIFNENYVLGIGKLVVIDKPVCNYIQDDRGTTLSTKKRMDKIPIALRLYQESTQFFQKMQVDDRDMPATKAVMEFLDEVEGLAYDREMKRAAKIQAIHQYENALKEVGAADKRIELHLLDYKIIYWFLKRNCTTMVHFLVEERGLIVKLLKKRG